MSNCINCHQSTSSQCNVVRYRQGPTGPTGPTGIRGLDGTTGPPGPMGATGAPARTILLTDTVTNGQTRGATAPAGARFADITIIGAGGAGGLGVTRIIDGQPFVFSGYGGGGAGGIIVTNFPVLSGVPYSMIGGTGGVVLGGANGTNSSFTIAGATFIATFGLNATDATQTVLSTPGIGGTGIIPNGFGTTIGIGATAQGFTGSDGIFGGGGPSGIANAFYGNGGSGGTPNGVTNGQGGSTTVVFYA